MKEAIDAHGSRQEQRTHRPASPIALVHAADQDVEGVPRRNTAAAAAVFGGGGRT